MQTVKLVAVLACFLLTVHEAAAQTTREKALREIAAAENAFANYAAANGARAAFLKFAADNAVVFVPQPANAKEVWSKKKAMPFFLNWRPNWVDAASSGDIGFSTGSSSFHPKGATDAAVAWGDFFTIWKRQPNGEWRWVLDGAVDHPETEVLKDSWTSPPVAESGKIKNSKETWASLESDFARLAEKEKLLKTYSKLASDEIRLLRQNRLPMQGKTKTLDFLSNQNNSLKIKPAGGERVADFAYAYGEYEMTMPGGKIEKGFYTRVWRLEAKGWRISADAARPNE